MIELLVVIAIIAILAAILFPVFAQAKTAAKSTLWLSNVRQTSYATYMYAGDNDDNLPFVNSGGLASDFASHGLPLCWGCGRPDYVWFELVQPYTKNYDISACPADTFTLNQRHLNWQEQPIGPSNENYWYAVAVRTNIGYNYEFMSPWIYETRGSQKFAGSQPTSLNRAASPSGTLMQVDSLWDRKASGQPTGGGNWIVEPPCVYDTQGKLMEPMDTLKDQGIWYHYNYPNGGWRLGDKTSWLEFGGTWPWFNNRFRVTYMDSHVGTVALGRLADGCDLKPRWGGKVTDHDRYMWDLR